MPTIDFHTYNTETLKNFKPVLAKDVIPDWWKKQKVGELVNGTLQQTIRACPAMDDWLKMGWYLVANRDMEILLGTSRGSADGTVWAAAIDTEAGKWIKDDASSSHPSTQTSDAFSYLGTGENPPIKDAFKMKNPWNIKTPKGYSCFYLDPFLHQNKYFSTWQGIIDTDEFNVNEDNAQIIFYPKVDHSFIIKKGTPLCQVIPFKREEWVGTYSVKTPESYIKNLSDVTKDIDNISMIQAIREADTGQSAGHGEDSVKSVGPYKKLKLWKPKQKFFNEESPPPECPFHVSEDKPAPDEVQLELNLGDPNGS